MGFFQVTRTFTLPVGQVGVSAGQYRLHDAGIEHVYRMLLQHADMPRHQLARQRVEFPGLQQYLPRSRGGETCQAFE